MMEEMEKKFSVGEEIEVLTQIEPDVWTRASIRSGPSRIGYGVTFHSEVEAHAMPWHIRPVNLSLGDLEGIVKIKEAFNGLYVYLVETGECRGAGDGTETTLADLAEFARSDPDGFVEAYGPTSLVATYDGPPEVSKCLGFTLVRAGSRRPSHKEEGCEVCGAKVDGNTLSSVDIGFGPPLAKWLCPVCYTGIFTVTTPGGKTATFVNDPSTPWEQSAGYFYHFGDGYSGVEAMRFQGQLPPKKG